MIPGLYSVAEPIVFVSGDGPPQTISEGTLVRVEHEKDEQFFVTFPGFRTSVLKVELVDDLLPLLERFGAHLTEVDVVQGADGACSLA